MINYNLVYPLQRIKKPPRRELADRAKSKKDPSLVVCRPCKEWKRTLADSLQPVKTIKKDPRREFAHRATAKKPPFSSLTARANPKNAPFWPLARPANLKNDPFRPLARPANSKKDPFPSSRKPCKPKSSYANKGLQHIPGGVAQDVDCLLSVPPPTPHHAEPLQKKQPEPILTKSERARVAKPRM